MSDIHFDRLYIKWQSYWIKNNTYKTHLNNNKPKFYILDMFPYPSGAGLHVGHPLGYIASDIVARYKRLKGFNVLHPMGFDAFGLPAEQYAIQTGQHPAITTDNNIKKYKEQLRSMGFSYDWDREVRTSDPSYYKWTQWLFKVIYNSWYNLKADKAEPIDTLIRAFEESGNENIEAHCDADTLSFNAIAWRAFSEKEKQTILLKYRLTYLADTTVNWCPELGTVLSNDEVKDGFSERGSHPVVKKKMPQWNMRTTAYAERLLEGLERIDWPEPIKEMQRNWIGKSIGAEVDFQVVDQDLKIRVFTTRIDTIYGVTFLTLAPESELINQLVTDKHQEEVKEYIEMAINRSERDRMSDVKSISGVFTGSYAVNPFNQEKLPIWVADYVLSGYGTGSVMAVPASDDRDFRFAKHFDLPIIPVIAGTDLEQGANDAKTGKMINSGLLDGLEVKDAIEKAIQYVEKKNIGKAKINYKMRDAIFGRQRYWGEPFPVYYKDGVPHLVPDEELPLKLPNVDAFLPTEEGGPPLGRAKDWKYKGEYPFELTTMPGWAGSSWYFFRYMDPDNNEAFVSKAAQEYWQAVDLYLGGSEHATGHLLYSRFWTKILFDLGYVSVDEYAKKLINQGMIQGRSNFVYRVTGENKYVSYGLRKDYQTTAIHVDVNIVENDELDIEAFKKFKPETINAEFVLEGGKYICGAEVEKMSKSKYNVVNPDDIIEKYGADTLRLYEMFLGPIEQFKPWNTNGIDGVYKFLKKYWNLFFSGEVFSISDEEATSRELKVLHQTIRKVGEDIENLSLNTSVSQFMIAVNELTSLKCNKRKVLKPLTIVLSPFAPHITEELWHRMGHNTTINDAEFPQYESKYLIEESHEYPVSVNGKMRAKMTFPLDMPKEAIEKQVLAAEVIQKWLAGKNPKKVIVVPKKIVNVVV